MADYQQQIHTDAALAQQLELANNNTGAPTTRRRTRGAGGTTKARTTNSRNSRGSAKSTSRGGKTTTGRGRGSALKEAKANAARLKRKRELLEEGLPVQKWCRVKRPVKNGGWKVWVWVPVSELVDGELELVQKGTLKRDIDVKTDDDPNNELNSNIGDENNDGPTAKRLRVESDADDAVDIDMEPNGHGDDFAETNIIAPSHNDSSEDNNATSSITTDDVQQQVQVPAELTEQSAAASSDAEQQDDPAVAEGFASFASENMMDDMLRMMQQQQQNDDIGGDTGVMDADLGADLGF